MAVGLRIGIALLAISVISVGVEKFQLVKRL